MDNKYLERLESIGPEKVLVEIALGRHGEPGSRMRSQVDAWLKHKELNHQLSSYKDGVLREEMALKLAAEANSIALKARSDARIANIIAITAIVLTIIMAIGQIIEWFSR